MFDWQGGIDRETDTFILRFTLGMLLAFCVGVFGLIWAGWLFMQAVGW